MRFHLVIIEKEQRMKNLSNILSAVGLASGLGACGIAAFSIFVIFAASFGFGLPFFYFQRLNMPLLAVLLPVAGMLALLPIALRLAFARAAATIPNNVVEIEKQKPAVEEKREEYLKAA
jgi:hypothetical protein